MASLERELEEVVGHIRAVVRGQLAVAEEAKKIVQNELIEVKNELIEVKDEAERQMSVLNADNQELQAELERSAKRIDILTTEIRQAEDETRTAEAKAEKAEAKAEKAEAKAETAKAEAEKAKAEANEAMASAKRQIEDLKKELEEAKVMREEDAVKAVDAHETQLPGSPQRVQSPEPGSPQSVQSPEPGSPQSVPSPVLGYIHKRNPGEQDKEEMETGVAGGACDGASRTESEDEGLSAPSSPLREGSHNIQVARPQGGPAGGPAAGPAPEVTIEISDDDSQSWLAPETPAGTPAGTPVVPAAGLAPETQAGTPAGTPVVPAAGQKRGDEGGASDKQEHKKPRLDEDGASAKQSPSSRLVPEKPTGPKRKAECEASAKQSPSKKPRFDYPTRAMKRLFEAFEEDYSNPQKWNEFQHLFLKTFRELDVSWGALQIQKGWDENTTDELFVRTNKRMTRFKKHADEMKELGYNYSGSGEDQFMRTTKKGDSEGSVVVYLMYECARYIHNERDFKEK